MNDITTRAPLRLTLCGGGNDLPIHWRRHGGFMMTAAIDKYVTVKVGNCRDGICAENADLFPRIRAAGHRSGMFDVRSEVPPGSGLGGSSALLVALLKARWPELDDYELAMAAYNIERYSLGEPAGLQDAFIASFGGCLQLEIDQAGRVAATPFRLPSDFADRLILMHTGIQRSAGEVLEKQVRDVSTKLCCRAAMEKIAGLAWEIYRDLQINGGKRFGELTEEHWQYKRASSPAVTTPQIDAWHDLALANGATGGKCCGAGAGGFLLLVTEPSKRGELVRVMTDAGLVEMPFGFSETGAEVVA